MTDAAGPKTRWRFADGEWARLVPPGAEIESRGPLPLRTRMESHHHARPAFPGTAVVIGDATFEVVHETERDGVVAYRLRAWPAGEVTRDRVVYDGRFVQEVEAGRQRMRSRERTRPFRWLISPLVGLLPEDPQAKLCDRFGLDARTATLAGGLLESTLVMMLLDQLARRSDTRAAIVLVVCAPGLALFVLPGLGRVFGALALGIVGGSPVVSFGFELLRALGVLRRHRDLGFVPLTRAAFWERLARPDVMAVEADGTVLCRSLLPHLSWTGGRRIEAGGDYWRPVPLGPEWRGGRIVYRYRLELERPLEEGEVPPDPPSPTAYADEVMGTIGAEWDAFNQGFPWLTGMLSVPVQARAFGHRGGPAAVRRPAVMTAAGAALAGVYLLFNLYGSPAADPLAPVMFLLAVVLLLDAALRGRSIRARQYAPSLFRFLLPSGALRAERVAYREHLEAERKVLQERTRERA